MSKHRKWLLPLALAAAWGLSACGGGGGDSGGGGATPAPPDVSSVSALLAFMNSLIAGTSEISEPVDINPLTLAVDDMGDPAPL